MTEEKLPDMLPTIEFPASTYEWNLNATAKKYNSLDSRSPQRREIYEKWKDEKSRADWD